MFYYKIITSIPGYNHIIAVFWELSIIDSLIFNFLLHIIFQIRKLISNDHNSSGDSGAPPPIKPGKCPNLQNVRSTHHFANWNPRPFLEKKKCQKKVVTVGIDLVIPDVESGALTTELEISS